MPVELMPGALRAARERLGLSRQAVVDWVQQHEGRILGGKLVERAERLHRIGDMDNLVLIAKALELPVHQLLPAPPLQAQLDAYGLGPEPPPRRAAPNTQSAAHEVLDRLAHGRACCVHGGGAAEQSAMASLLAAGRGPTCAFDAVLWVEAAAGGVAVQQTEIASALGFDDALAAGRSSPTALDRAFVHGLWARPRRLLLLLLGAHAREVLTHFLPSHRAVLAVVFTNSSEVAALFGPGVTRLTGAEHFDARIEPMGGSLLSELAVFGLNRFSGSWAAAVTGRPLSEVGGILSDLADDGVLTRLGPSPSDGELGDYRLTEPALVEAVRREELAPAMSRLVAASRARSKRLEALDFRTKKESIARYGGLWRGLLSFMATRIEAALGLVQIPDDPKTIVESLVPLARSTLAGIPSAEALPTALLAMGHAGPRSGARRCLLPAFIAAATGDFTDAQLGSLAWRRGDELLPSFERALPWYLFAAEAFRADGALADSAMMLDAAVAPAAALGRLGDCLELATQSLKRSRGVCPKWLIAARQSNVGAVTMLLASSPADPILDSAIDSFDDAVRSMGREDATAYVHTMLHSNLATARSAWRPADDGEDGCRAVGEFLEHCPRHASVLPLSTLHSITGAHEDAIRDALSSLLEAAQHVDPVAVWVIGALIDQQIALSYSDDPTVAWRPRSPVPSGIAVVAMPVPEARELRFGVLYDAHGLRGVLGRAFVSAALPVMRSALGPGHSIVTDLYELRGLLEHRTA